MKVLVCDDDVSVGPFMTALFEAESWETELTASGAECLDALEGGSCPDVLVLDQEMPGLRGTEVASMLREEGFSLPIVLCSAHLGPEIREDISRLGLIPVNKIDMQALVRVVGVAGRVPAARRVVDLREQILPLA